MHLRFIFLIPFCFAFSQQTLAADSEAKSKESPSFYTTRIEASTGLYSGKSGQSLSGLKIYSASLVREQKMGSMRPQVYLGYAQTRGSLPLDGSQTSIELSKLFLAVGILLFPYPDSDIAPHLGISGFGERGSLEIPSPPSSNFAIYSRPNLYGYELSLGFDIQSKSESLLRFKVAYATEIGKFGSSSNFRSQVFKFGISL